MNKENQPLVSIITLNWNQTEVTCEFLESSRNLTYKNYEILVCDMNSDINPASKIQSFNFPNTKVLVSDKNLGFAAGNNWGMKQARGDYFFIVNNDTELNPSLIEQLLEPFSCDPKIGVTCPKILYYHNPGIIQYAGFNKMNMLTGRTTSVGGGQKDEGQFNISGITNGAHGCAMMVKREVAEKAGMFPSRFFLYYEEWDWSMRIINAGYKIFYQANAFILHKESLSVGKESLLKLYYLNRNRILFMRRNCNTFQLIGFIGFYALATFPKNVVQYLVKGKIKALKTYLKAVAWNFKNSSFSELS